jgi:methyltransferase (TIGR00027 family)
MMAALARNDHRLIDAPPWVLDDPLALVLIGPAWREIEAAVRTSLREPVVREGVAGVVTRSRYAEDRLVAGSFSQYVILGAGLDSFAWRRPDLLRSVRVFEVDHPASQAWKRQRVTDLALPVTDGHVFAPIDFETATLSDGLTAAGFDWSRPTLFSWLGVTFYLTQAAIEATLRTVAICPAGSEVVLTYCPTSEFLDAIGSEFLVTMSAIASASGEPIQSRFAPADLETIIHSCGLRPIDHPTREDLIDRYFSERADRLKPYTVERLLAAVVPS